jgi:hypothetical protein
LFLFFVPAAKKIPAATKAPTVKKFPATRVSRQAPETQAVKKGLQVLEIHNGKVLRVFRSAKDAAAVLLVSASNMHNIIKKGRHFKGKKYTFAKHDDTYEAEAYRADRISVASSRAAAKKRKSARKVYKEPEQVGESNGRNLQAETRRKIALQKRINFENRTKIQSSLRTLSRKLSDIFNGPPKEPEDEKTRCYIVFTNWINPNEAGTTSNDAPLKRRKEQVVIAPLSSNGTANHFVGVMKMLDDPFRHGGYAKDTDMMIDHMGFSDEYYDNFHKKKNDKK